jgi:protoporphyrinogen oxidase
MEDLVAAAQRPASGERWAVVGGGMLGLTLAHRLAQRGLSVTVFEGAPQLGGLASAWQLGDVVWDRHYHVTLLSDARLRSLLRELGLENAMEWVTTRTGVFAGGHLHSVSNTVEFLRFPALGLVDKLRLGATIAYGARIRNWRRLERIPVSDWLVRLSGRRTFERFWGPLLRSKLGESYRETSAAFIWATIARLYAARRTGLKREMFGYVPGGYARVLERFAEVLTQEKVEICTSAPVRQVVRDGTGLCVEQAEGKRRFDRVVVTLAAPLAARVCPELTEDERQRLNGVRYLGIVCASLLLNRPLADYYVTNLTDEGFPFTGVIEMSTLVDRVKYLGGLHLVYLPRYVTPEDPFFQLPDAEVEAQFLEGLGRIYPAFRRSDVRAFRLSRVRQVCALSTLGYSDRLPPQRTSVPGLWLANSAHIVNGTLNVNETVELAENTFREMMSDSTAAAGQP